MSKFWNVAKWFVDPIGSIGQAMEKGLNSFNGLTFDKNYDGWTTSEIKNTIQGLWKDYTGLTANEQNIAYQKEYNEEVWNRADTQYQRTVADLRKAGLSPQLASGSPGTVAGAAVAPQRTVGNESQAIERLVGMVNAVKQTNSQVALAGAQADEAAAKAANYGADTALKEKELGGFDEYRSMELAVMGSSVALNNAYTRVAQIDGQYKAAKYAADIQNTMANTRYTNSLIKLCEKNVEVADSQIALNKANSMLSGSKALTEFATRRNLNANTEHLGAQTEYIRKEKEYLSFAIATEIARYNNLTADTKRIIQNTTNAALDYVISDYTFKFKKEHGDSPDSSVPSTTQLDENKRQWKRQLLSGVVSSITSVMTGAAAGFALSIGTSGGKFFMNKMLGNDDHKPWGLTH